jgi:hypothetical protein
MRGLFHRLGRMLMQKHRGKGSKEEPYDGQ